MSKYRSMVDVVWASEAPGRIGRARCFVLHAAGVAIAGILSVTSDVSAATITTLFNTGVDSAGTPLSHGTSGDPHYALNSVPVGSTTATRIITSAGGFPIPPYIGDNALSAWIGPNNDDDVTGPAGTYTYRTTFDLTSLDPSTASIVGGWTTDNNGLDILINGVSQGFTTGVSAFSSGFSAFSVTSDFVAGVNTLDFVVNNQLGSTALRVEMTGTASPLVDPPSPVPVPATLGLLAVATLTLVLRRGRQRI